MGNIILNLTIRQNKTVIFFVIQDRNLSLNFFGGSVNLLVMANE